MIEHKDTYNKNDFLEYFKKYKDIQIEKDIANENI